jgi:hypothetical protein
MNVVEALGVRVSAAQAVKTLAAFAEVDGIAQGAGLEEVEFFEVDGGRRVGEWVRVERRVEVGGERVDCVVHGDFARHGGQAGTDGGNFFGQAHFEDVAGFAALDETEGAQGHEAAYGFADRASADANAASEPGHGAVELELAFKTRVAKEIEVDSAVHNGEAQTRVENVSELGPEKLQIEFCRFHG